MQHDAGRENMKFLGAIKSFFAPQRIATPPALADFLESRAAYLVQKSVAEYSQARAGIGFSTLLGEAEFQSALERAKWLGYPASFSMVAEAIAGHLSAVAPADRIEPFLTRQARQIFSKFPVPQGESVEFWRIAESDLAADLARASLGQPKPAHAIAASRADEVFAVLPLHPKLRTGDFEMFRNTLRFHLTEISAEFEERGDPTALAKALG